MPILSCSVCACEFDAKTNRRMYCSAKCKDKGKPSAQGLTCFICGGGMQKGATSTRQGEAAHNACRSGGARNKAEYMQRWHAKFKAENGMSSASAWRRRFRDEYGYWPQLGGSDWISGATRKRLYVRDGWRCYLCNEALSSATPVNHPKALTLDHFIPRSRGGTDDTANLRTCCRECNIRKSDRMPEEVSHGWQEAVAPCAP